MEARVIGRGVISGFFAGVLAFVFARIFAEPVIDKAIAYESGRDDVLNALRKAAGLAQEPDGPEIFSRSIQADAGMATGVIGVSMALGALVAVAFILCDGKFSVRPRVLAWLITAFGFLGVFLLPFVKYPANPPAVGHEFTVVARGHLYVAMVALSLVLLGLATFATYRLAPRFGTGKALLASGLGFLVAFGVVLALMPSLGDLHANVASAHDLGFARSATETPQAITNVTGKTLRVDGKTYAPGQLVYPGFDADELWKFRWYSLLDQLIIWSTIGLVFGAFMDRALAPASAGSRTRRADRVERRPVSDQA